MHLADFAPKVQRTLSSAVSAKPLVAVDPSGRAYWLDDLFATAAVFVDAP